MSNVDMSNMVVEVKWHEDMWQEIKDSAMFTIHKFNGGKYPDSKWKSDLLLSEHSPIRNGRLIINCYNVPSFVIGHIVRHGSGFVPFVSSLRDDRSEYEDGKVPDRNTPNGLRFDGNFQHFINISRRRECTSASKETRQFWEKVLLAVKEFEPELQSRCVRECIYRGGCPEYPKSCGWWEAFCKRNSDHNLLDIHERYDVYNEERDKKQSK